MKSSFALLGAVALSLGACSGEPAGDDAQGTGGSAETGGAPAASGGAAAGGGPSAGGSSSGGGSPGSGGAQSSGGAASGGANPAGGGAAGGAQSTGGASSGGSESSGGSDNTGGSGEGGGLPLGNPPVKSAGCGKPATIMSGKRSIMSSGQDRSYIIDIPNNYDENEPHRLFYTSHWIGSTSEAVRDQDYYFLKPLAQADGVRAIFVAPQSDGATWQQKDHALFDDLLAFVKENLCIDTTRVFATGFSFGGMITYSLSTNHQQDIRAAVGIAPANYNIWLPQKTREPIAWMHTTGLQDGTCPWVNNEGAKQGAKFIAIEKAEDNGCKIPAEIPIHTGGNHVCYEFEDCDPGYPTRVCTFGGGHTNIDNEGGKNWIAEDSWDFFMRF
jgi:poly(3-hydroxybutyrate) depolymerase